jgi:hypothetical protein
VVALGDQRRYHVENQQGANISNRREITTGWLGHSVAVPQQSGWGTATLCPSHPPFDDVPQFADVARPGVARHPAHRIGREAANLDRLPPLIEQVETIRKRHTASLQIVNCRYDPTRRQIAAGIIVPANNDDARVMTAGFQD